MKISIVIPAYNESKRIENTLNSYVAFFNPLENQSFAIEYVVVANGCRDNTADVIEQLKKKYQNIFLIDIPYAGKGMAIKAGFADALTRPNDFIGFVDADMATKPEYFYTLIAALGAYDGIIASRYMPGAFIYPARPRIKRWGSRLVYEPLIRLLFGLNYYDLQCGAKLFKRHVIQAITPLLSLRQWAFDLELLYVCKRAQFTINEVPTIWYDQEGSKLRTFKSGFAMLGSLIKLRLKYSPFKKFIR
jgi:glycosyltransferase involved in cell wall biosynthesis